jgi:ankyrin repeat protein
MNKLSFILSLLALSIQNTYSMQTQSIDAEEDESSAISSEAQQKIQEDFGIGAITMGKGFSSVLAKFKKPCTIKSPTLMGTENYEYIDTLKKFVALHKIKLGLVEGELDIQKYFQLQQILFKELSTELLKSQPITKISGYKTLVKYCSPNLVKDTNNLTLLHIAAYNGHPNIVNLFLKSKANPNAQTVDEKITPLHFAAQNGHYDVAFTLLAKGANVDAVTSNRTTPLHLACANGFSEIVTLLLNKNAKPNIQVLGNGETPLLLATMANNLDAVDSLLNKNAYPNTKTLNTAQAPLHIAAMTGNLEIAKKLVFNNADVQVKTSYKGETPLHIAAQNGHSDLCKFFIENHANIDEKRKDNGATPLHLAVLGGHMDTVKILLTNKANPKIVANVPGSTPLVIAQLCLKNKNISDLKKNGYKKIVELLKIAIYGAAEKFQKFDEGMKIQKNKFKKESLDQLQEENVSE